MVNDRLKTEQWVITGHGLNLFQRVVRSPDRSRQAKVSAWRAQPYEWESGKIKKYDAYFDRVALYVQTIMQAPQH